MFIVNSIIFIYRKINSLFSYFHTFGKRFRSFLKESNSVIRESLIALLICAIGDLFAGIVLGKMTFFLETFPGLLVIIPGAIGMRGNIFGALGSRLGSNLHIGLLSPEFKKSEILTENILSSLILTLILSIFLAFIAKGICILFNFRSMSLIDFTLISFFAGVISSIIMLPITMSISLKSFQHGWDPDNITTPLIAAFGDLFTLPSIVLALIILSIFQNTSIKLILFIIVILITFLGFYHGIKRDGEMKRIIKQSTPILLLCSVFGISAGGILNNSISTFLKNPSLLTLVPLFSGESGSLISILGARLSSSLHSGLINPILKFEKITLNNFLIIIILAIIVYPVIGLLAESSSILLYKTGIGFFNITLISTVSGIFLILIMIFIVFYISSLSYKNGLDPDNIVIPISTSITDLISNLFLVLVSILILGIILT